MTLNLINQSRERAPRAFLSAWVAACAKKLKLRSKVSLTVVFVGRARSRQLNRQFRRKDRPTDVLSFGAVEKGSLGELVLCVPLVKSQAKEHELSFNEELGYLVLHGILHLLGYEHENGGREARRMFRLQDRLFEDLCRQQSGDRSRKT